MSDTFDFDEDEPKKQTGMIVISGGLGLLLLVMNLWPDGDNAQDNAQAVTQAAQVTTTTPTAAVEAAPVERKINWPKLLFSDVIRTNPFQMNRHLEEALDAVDNPESRSDVDSEDGHESDTVESIVAPAPHVNSAEYPVKFVFRGPRGAAAMIRDKVYHEGDRIDGMQVVRIGEHGVTLRLLPVSPLSDRN